MPLVGGSSVLDIRFEAPGAHWAAEFLRLSLESVQPDVTRRAAQMTSAGVAHTAPVTLRDLARPSAILTRTQWAIASRVDGTLSPRDLARQSGLSLYETITSLGALIRVGLCAPVPLEPQAASRPAPAAATVSSLPPATAATTPLPPDALSRLLTRATSPAHSPAAPVPAAPAAAHGPAAPAHAQPAAASANGAAPSPASAKGTSPKLVTGTATVENAPGQTGSGAPAAPWPTIDSASPRPASADPVAPYSAPVRPAPTAHPVPSARPAPWADPLGPAQPAAAAIPPVRPTPDESSPSWSPTAAPDARPAADASWPDAATPATPAVSATTGPWAGTNGTSVTPAERDSFAPVTPAPRAASGRPAAPAASAISADTGPQGLAPAVNPAPVDVPAPAVASPGLPSYPSYRRPVRRPWRQSDAPVPPERLAGPSGRPSDADLQRVASVRAEPAGAHAARGTRGAHRADRSFRPETPDPATSLPPDHPPHRLPQRQPVRIAGRPYSGTRRAWPQAITKPFPAVPDGQPRPGSFTTPHDADAPPERPIPPDRYGVPEPASTPPPAWPRQSSPGGAGSEEEFAPAAPDLLRRVLEGLRRLA